jgi:hypothetical protein
MKTRKEGGGTRSKTASLEGKWIGKVTITDKELMKDRSDLWDAIQNVKEKQKAKN